MLETFSRVDDAIAINAELAEAILESGVASLGLSGAQVSHSKRPPWYGTASKLDLDKAKSTINQLYRDWSAEGEVERAACYGPVIQDLTERFSQGQLESEDSVKVLVPGAGLGRLVYELCARGFDVEGNEISYHQLLASSFILNHTTRPHEWTLHPWAFSFSNNLSRENQLAKVLIPDVHPRSLECTGNMSMSTGDFCVVYRADDQANTFDAVATVFFIDTAPNLINYIETVKHCLKPGGIWTNLGPLLWHSVEPDKRSDSTKAALDENKGIGELGSFELSEDEVIALLQTFGFEIRKHESNVATTGYVQNPRSILRNVYHPCHWVAMKMPSQ